MRPVKSVLVGDALWQPKAALDALFARVDIGPSGTQRLPIERVAGRVLATDVAAVQDHPDTTRSAMDGFAVRAADTPGRLNLVGEVRMGGADSIAVGSNRAVRIPTGGTLPDGTDAVVPVEEAQVDGDWVTVQAVASGEHAIARGADLRAGEPVLRAGRRIASPQAGLLAALGIESVEVFERPTVALISSGDELVPVWSRPQPGQVRDSNRYALAASLRAMGARVRHYPIVVDDFDACRRALGSALEACDALVVSGGSSAGERDYIPAVVAALGAPGVIAHGFAIKPGKPALLGAIGAKPVLGLPGNPTSALLVLEAICAPAIAALCGEPVRGRAGWTFYQPMALTQENGRVMAHPLPLQSFSVGSPARADGYGIVEAAELASGDAIDVHPFLG